MCICMQACRYIMYVCVFRWTDMWVFGVMLKSQNDIDTQMWRRKTKKRRKKEGKRKEKRAQQMLVIKYVLSSNCFFFFCVWIKLYVCMYECGSVSRERNEEVLWKYQKSIEKEKKKETIFTCLRMTTVCYEGVLRRCVWVTK